MRIYDLYSMVESLKKDLTQMFVHGTCVEVFVGTTDDQMFVIEAHFYINLSNGDTEVVTAYSNIDARFLLQYHNDHIHRQILMDILVDVSTQMQDYSTIH